MRALLALAAILEIALAVALFAPSHVNRPSLARAYVEWQRNPTPEKLAAWEQEKLTTQRINLATAIVLLGLLGLNTMGIVKLVRRIRGGQNVLNPVTI